MRKQKILAMLLALAMVVGLLPTTALAAKAVDEQVAIPAPAADEQTELPAPGNEAWTPADPLDAAELLAETTADATGSVVGKAYSDDPNAYEIYPVPHSVVYPTDQTPFTLTQAVNVVADGEVDSYTTDFVKELLERFGHTMVTSNAVDNTKTNIILAIHGDSDAVTSATNVFDGATPATGKFDPYILKAEAGTDGHGLFTIIGEDTDCVYYGVATLQMMFTSFNGERFLPVQIEDYSNVALRGFIEGFYGGFNYVGRESQVRSIRDVKGNMYVFASKTDPYHGGNKWNQVYPADELAQIKDLVDVCKAMKVEYTWSFHLGKSNVLGNKGTTISDENYATNLAAVIAKFEQLYGIGVRSFHILNDDYNSGTYATQVKFLNDINVWLAQKGDCMPLVYCIGGYNIEWSGWSAYTGELEALKNSDLDDNIYFYWTGSRVNSPITQENISYLYDHTGHYPVTWLNYPCSEHDKAGVYLGNLKHYVDTANGLENQYGFMSNPIGLPEANKVAYFQLLSWCWNRDEYTTYMDEIWKDCFKYLQPEVWESYYTIAQNTSNCPDSGRYPDGFPESEHLRETLAAVQAALLSGDSSAAAAEVAALKAELDKIVSAVAHFRANCANTNLKAELEPHLKSLESVATACKEAIWAAEALNINDVNTAWNHFSAGAVALAGWDANRPFIDYNGYQDKWAKAGSKRLQPFANAVLSYVETAMAETFNPGGGLTGELVPMIKLGDAVKPDNAEARKMLDGDPASYAGYGVNQVVGDYFGVDLGAVTPIAAIDILQGQNDTHHDYFHKARLECSVDGEHWTELVTKVNSHHIAVDGLDIVARYVRLRLLETGYTGSNGQYGDGVNYWTYIREFTVTPKETGLLYTDVANTDGVTAAADGGAYTLTIPSLTLGTGEYVGIKLPEIVGIRAITAQGTLPEGVKLQHSVSGIRWTDGSPAQTTRAGYVRLMNGGSAAAALTGVTVTATAPVRTELSFVSSNVGIHQGNVWTNVVDGNRDTFAWTNGKQEPGQHAIFDLGGLQPIYDISVYFPDGDGEDHPKSLKISVGSTSSGPWTDIHSFVNSDYEVVLPVRRYSCNGNGVTGRYVKLEIVESLTGWVKINELEVNKTVTQEEGLTAVYASSGTAAHADDGDLLTFFAPDAGQAGNWTKLLQAPTAFDAVTVLRGEAGASATVQVQKGEADWTPAGTLTSTATTIDLSGQGPITGVRVQWTAGDVPDIAEVLLAGDSIPVGEVPTLYPNIYEQPASPAAVTVANGTAAENLPLPDRATVTTSGGIQVQLPVTWNCGSYDAATAGTYTFVGEFDLTDALITNPGGFTFNANVTVRAAEGGSGTPENLALNKTVYVSGVEVADQTGPALAVDGNSDTRWSTNYMKVSSGAVNGSNPSWIVVDLGTNVESITALTMEYFNLVWPATYVVQVAGSDYTPKDFSSNVGTVAADHEAFSGQHAKDASCWTTVKSFADQSLTAHPTDRVTQEELSAAQLPDSIRYVRLFFSKMNGNAGGNAIGLEELTLTGVRSVAVIPDITSITPVTSVGVKGDAWDTLDVPTHVIATLSDDTKVRIPVAWSHAGYDANANSEQSFTGTLTLPSNVTNTGNVAASLTVTLTVPPDVTGFTVTPNRITARHRTPFAGLVLPETAVLQFSNGAVRTLSITWDESSYDPNSLDDQTVTGTVTRPWSKTEYTVSVLVRLDPILATSVTVSPKTIDLYANESHNNRSIRLTAAVGGEDASDKTVVWRSSDVSIATVSGDGVVTAMGPGTANIIAIAHDGSRVSDTCAVTVKWALEGNVTVTGGPRVGSTLTAQLNSFVQDAKRSIDIQWWRKGKDDAEFTALADATEQDYTVEAVAANVGTQYKVVITGKGLYEGTSDSEPITMTKLAGEPLKALPTFTNVSVASARDGEITGLFKGRLYEYKKVDNGTDDPGEDGWTEFSDMTGDETASDSTFGTAKITGLGEGNYAVRRAADDLHEAGAHRTVTIAVKDASLFVVTNPQTFTGGTVTVGRTQIPERDTVRLTVQPNDGYELVPNSLKAVTADGTETIATEKSDEPGIYTFTMPSAAVTISAQFRLKTYTIEHDLTNITCDMAEHDHTATHGERFTITLTPETGHEMKPDTITVTKTGTTETFTDYTYLPDRTDPAKRVLTFTHGVTCNLTISGEAVLKEYTIEDRLEDLTCDMGDLEHHKVPHGTALTITISPKEGCVLPAAKESITITMGGADFTDFTYTVVDGTHAEITFAVGKITGDLTISAAAPIPLTSAAIHGVAQVGEQLTADVRPSNATVDCKWIIMDAEGNEEAVTSDALVIPAEAEGKTIKLEVTGTGRYSGVLTTDPIGAVTPALADKSALRAAYDDGLTVQDDNYTAATWNTFQEALNGAASVLDNSAATQAQIDDALVILRDARAALKKQSTSRPGTSTPSTSTTTKVEEDGTKITTVTKPDGSKVQTVEQPNGTKSELAVTKDGDVTITVTDENGEQLVKTEIPASIPAPETKFEDVAEITPWAEEAINKMAGLELVNGTGNNKYSPVAPMTRGSLATVLRRLSQGKTDYEVTFQDVAQGKYYTEGVAWAAKAKVVTGYTADIFAPDDIITREQLAVMMSRYAKLVGLNTKADAKALDRFTDGDATGTWAVDGVAWCVQNGILKGKGGNILDPTAEVTRAEVAVMLDRFIALLK